MKKIIFILLMAGICFSETFHNFDYEVLKETKGFYLIELFSDSVTPEIIVQLIEDSEKEYPVIFECMLTPNLYLFRKVKK